MKGVDLPVTAEHIANHTPLSGTVIVDHFQTDWSEYECAGKPRNEEEAGNPDLWLCLLGIL